MRNRTTTRTSSVRSREMRRLLFLRRRTPPSTGTRRGGVVSQLLEKTKSGSGVDATSPPTNSRTRSLSRTSPTRCARGTGPRNHVSSDAQEEFGGGREQPGRGERGVDGSGVERGRWTGRGLVAHAACGRGRASAADPSGPVPADVGAPGCDLAPAGQETARRVEPESRRGRRGRSAEDGCSTRRPRANRRG